MTLVFLPNVITLVRIALAPILILLLDGGDYRAALAVFAAAGVSDALDGFLAKRFHWTTRLGGVLDPLADKILLATAYIMLSILNFIPLWLVLAVVFRDLLIVGGYLAWTSLLGPVKMRPSSLSKFNTLAQIVLVFVVLAFAANLFDDLRPVTFMTYVVLATTLASGAHYVWVWGIMRDVEPAKEDAR